MIEPDKPVISIDASMMGELPPELREALSSLYDEQEQRRARERNDRERAYQDEQARALAADGGWSEVSTSYDEEALKREIACDLHLAAYEGTPAASAIHAESSRQGASIHQFYRDLYGIDFITTGRPVATVAGCAVPRVRFAESDLPAGSASVLVNHRDREHPFQLYADYRGFIDGVRAETSFIYMGGFWVPPNGFLTSKRNAMTSIGGFCVDIDRVDDEKGRHFPASWVMDTLCKAFDEHPEARPNYLMLSGTGIQLWYVFGRQVPLLSAKPRDGRPASPRRDKFGRLLKLMYSWFDRELPPNRFKVDVPCATINHAFRAPGSPTKWHYPTRLFAYGGRRRELADPIALSEFFGGDLRPYDVEDWNQDEYERIRAERAAAKEGRAAKASAKQVAYVEKLHALGCLGDDVLADAETMTVADADAAIKTGETVFTRRRQWATNSGAIRTDAGHVVPRKPRARGVYDATLLRLQSETPTGSRYWALFGLAGLAWNCCVPKSQLRRDMTALLGTEWAAKLSTDGKPLSKDDIEAAMRGYNELGALRTREQLEGLLKWSYGPPAKRNGKKRPEHLEFARGVKFLKAELGEDTLGGRPAGSGTKAEQVRAYAAAHPDANHSQIARALGVSRPTVIKWLKNEEKGAR